MALVDKILAILGSAMGIYGLALLAAWAMPSLRRLRVLAPRSWRAWTVPPSKHFITVRAGYMATFGPFVGLQAIDQHLLAVIFAVPTIIFAGILIEQSLRKSVPRADA
jgi:hypothetical protein